MTIRRINSTGRMKIVRDDAHVSVRVDRDGMLYYDARIQLEGYGLPGDASVFVEAYRQTTFMRFAHGTVSAQIPPSSTERRLTAFTTRDGLLFRVKVTSTGERAGILLAEADQIPISDDEEENDKRIALLPPFPEDLGQELWRLNFSGPNGSPLLLVNRDVGDWKATAGSPTFRSLVYPAAMRQILSRILFVERTSEVDDPSDWRCRWLAFAGSLPGCGSFAGEIDSNDDCDEWIDSAVEAFAGAHSMLSHFREAAAEESK